MSQMPNTPVKPPPHYVNQPAPTSSGAGRGCGCVIFGCGSVLLLLIVLCGAGWYMTWYTAMPLKWFASSLESSGDVRVEGVSGTISSGFEVDEFQFRDGSDGRWSKLSELKCKYGSTGGLFSSSGAAIEEISIGSGVIYGDFDLSTSNDIELLDITAPIEEMWSEISSEVQSDISEFRVDLVKFSNIEFRDDDDNVQFRIDEVRFSGLKIIDNRLEDIGELNIVVDHLKLKTEPSTTFVDSEFSRRLSGQMEAGFLGQVKQNIPFQIELGFSKDGQVLQVATWFDGKLEIARRNSEDLITTTAADFSSADYLDLPEPSIIPQSIQLKFEASSGKRKSIVSIDDQGSFRLGQTDFRNFAVADKELIEQLRKDHSNRRVVRTDRQFIASGTVDGETVTALVSVTNKLTLLDVQLFTTQDIPINQIWARTAYGQDFDQLPETAQNMIDRWTRNHLQPAEPSGATEVEEAEQEDNGQSGQAEREEQEDEQVTSEHSESGGGN